MISSGWARREGGEERRDLVRVVLAVGVEGDDRLGSGVEGVPEAATQGRALAGVGDLAQDGRPGGLGDRGGVVGRAVVDDDDRQVPERRRDHRRRSAGLPRRPG